MGLIGTTEPYKGFDYVKPRPQIIYPDGRVVYLDATTTATSSTATPPASTSAPASGDGASLSLLQNRQLWDVGNDILQLQQYFNTHGYVLAPSGVGAPGNETATFGMLTYNAIVKFQSAKGLPATGFLGPLTRAALSSMSTTTLAQ